MSRTKRWEKKKRRRQKNTLHDDAYKVLSRLYLQARGRSRQQDKKISVDKNYIYASRTYETYRKEAIRYIDWCKKEHPEILHLEDCRPYANDYLNYQITQGYSAWTIATRKAAIAKLLQISCTDLVETPSRNRVNIHRSRAYVERDQHISKEKEQYYAKLTSATGLRRHELTKIRGTDLHQINNPDGSTDYVLYVTRGTKGGKKRIAPVIGIDSEETEEIVDLFRNAGSALVCPKLPNAYDNHHYRGIYAKRLYGIHARKKIPKEDQYRARKELAGLVYDKKSMRIVSKALGHNRIDVIAQSYLY